jgi:hypothetical protein
VLGLDVGVGKFYLFAVDVDIPCAYDCAFCVISCAAFGVNLVCCTYYTLIKGVVCCYVYLACCGDRICFIVSCFIFASSCPKITLIV